MRFSTEKASSYALTEFGRAPRREPPEEHDIPSWEILPNASDDPEPLEKDDKEEEKEVPLETIVK